jgi:hypothetical protein
VFSENTLPEFLKEEKITKDEAEEDNSEISNFNTKGSLKARLYCKNKQAMENVFSNRLEEPRDSLVALLDKSIT